MEELKELYRGAGFWLTRGRGKPRNAKELLIHLEVEATSANVNVDLVKAVGVENDNPLAGTESTQSLRMVIAQGYH